jgi:hypothetical protein
MSDAIKNEHLIYHIAARRAAALYSAQAWFLLKAMIIH